MAGPLLGCEFAGVREPGRDYNSYRTALETEAYAPSWERPDMTDAVLIRSSLRRWDLLFVCVLGGVLLAGAAVAALAGEPGAAAAAAGVGVVLLLAGAAGLGYRIRRRRWVRLRPDGFVVFDRNGGLEIRDDQVLSVALRYQNHYQDGEPSAVTRRLRVWLATDAERPEPLDMVTRITVGTVDPLQGLLARLLNRLVEQARQDLRAGQSALGECWRLEHQELTIREQHEEKSCRLAEVAAVDRVGEHLNIWRQGMDRAWAEVPLASANLYVLEHLLAGYLAERSAPAAPVEGLGRILFERRPSQGWAAFFFAVAGLTAVAVALVAVFVPQVEVKLLVGLGAGALAVLSALIGLHIRRAVFRCHEHGVYQAGLRGERSLRYEEIGSLRYTAVRQYYHGAYLGTQFQLDLQPLPEVPARRVRYGAQLQHVDQELETLRDKVARRIAERMGQRLAAGEPVPWTERLRFLPEGIERTPGSLFGRKPPVVFPYADVVRHGIDNGKFALWVRGQKKPAFTEAISRRNFFPGYFLLADLVAGPTDGRAKGAG
jgi:hypothetical protein